MSAPYVAVKSGRYGIGAELSIDYFRDGAVVVVEVKSKKIKKLQREYHIRRRLFIEKYCRPSGWKLTEYFVK